MNDFVRRLLMLPPEGSSYAESVDHLHFAVFFTAVLGAIGVFTTAAVFMIRYRQRSPDQTTKWEPPNRLLEAAYIGIPLGVFLLWFFIGFSQFAYTQSPPANAMDVYVVAKQWMWKFTYPGGPNSIGVLRVPVGRPVRLLITSRDVIHSFFVPELRIKQDAVPGRYTQIWFAAREPGTWRIMCTEYCGIGHSQMWGELIALPPAEYERWYAQQQEGLARRRSASPSAVEPARPASSLAEQGRRVAAQFGCLACHTVDGRRNIGPTWTDLYMRRVHLSDGSTVIADEKYLTQSMMEPKKKVVAGFDPVMPSYRGRLAPAQVAAIVEYIKSLRTGVTHEREGRPLVVPQR